MRQFSLAILVLGVLSACSALPITVNLLPYLGTEASGTFAWTVVPGTWNMDLRLPDDQGFYADFSSAEIPVNFTSASLDYTVELTKTPPGGLSGTVTVQAYLAPATPNVNLWEEAYKLGDPRTFDLSTERLTISDQILLNPAQLQALNEGTLRFGIHLTGGPVTATTGGEVHFTYEITRLNLSVTLF